jgi:hypothetical protein
MVTFNSKIERRNFWFFGIGLFLILILVLVIPNLNDFQQLVVRWFASIMSAGVGYNIPGFLSVNWRAHLGNNIDTTIKASGAIAIFVVVYLVNPPSRFSDDTFMLTLRASSSSEPKIARGKAAIRIEDYSDARDFDTNGEATFKAIPRKYFGKNMKILPQVPGYAEEWIDGRADRPAIDVVLSPPHSHIAGLIIMPSGIKTSDLKIVADGIEGQVGERGQFDISLQSTGLVDLKVYLKNKLVYERTHMASTAVTISLEH